MVRHAIVICFCLLGITLPSYADDLKQFRNDVAAINFEYPGDWTLNQARKNTLFTLQHPEKIATISVRVYKMPEAVTVNGFQILRMTSVFDGWLNLFERPGTPYESLKANVDDSYVSVYSKHKLSENLKVKKYLIGEYYYLKGDTDVYLISIETSQRYWPIIQENAKVIVDSFWVGEGERPVVEEPEPISENWEMGGKAASNQNFIPADPQFTAKLNKQWEYAFPRFTFEDQRYINPVMVDDNLYVAVSKQLFSFQMASGTVNWTYDVGAPIQNGLICHDDIVYLIRDKGRPELLALLAHNGSILYRTYVNVNPTAKPIISGNTLLLFERGKLVAREGDSGHVIWRIGGIESDAIQPAATQQTVVAIRHGRKLIAVRAKDGRIDWQVDLPGKVINEPMIANNRVIVSAKTRNQSGYVTMAFRLGDGELLWSRSQERAADMLYAPATNIRSIFTLEKRQNNALVVQALDNRNGDVLWTQRLPQKDGLTDNRPIATESLLVLMGHNKANSRLLALDGETGEILESSTIKGKGPTKRIRLGLYKQRILLFRENDESASLICLK